MICRKNGVLWLIIVVLAMLSACSSPPKSSSSSASRGGGYYEGDGPGTSPPGNLHAIPNASPQIEKHAPANMRPYTVLGKHYIPQTGEQSFRQTGAASWYGKKFHGRKTANGEVYDMYAMTAAHPTLPLPSYAKVTRPRTGQSIVVRINDRGPFHSARIIDLSYVAAAKLGLIAPGSGAVVVEAITHEDIRSGRYQDGNAQTAVPEPGKQTESNWQLTSADTPDALEVLAKTQLENAMNDTPSWSSDANNQRLVFTESGTGTPETASMLKPISGSGVPRVYLQFGAFSAPQSATALVERINRQTRQVEYREAYIEPANELFRVQIGPYETRTEAINSALRIEQETGLQASLSVR